MCRELQWIFTQLPDDYIVLDTETTGLRDKSGQPDIVTLGLTVVRHRAIAASVEFKIRPEKPIAAQARSIHGIAHEQASAFQPFDAQWDQIAEHLKDQLIIIHNASFDWPILLDQVSRYDLRMPPIQGVFFIHKAAIPWAQAMSIACTQRGPSLDTLTEIFGIENLRVKEGGLHGAEIDSRQTARVVETMRRSASAPF